MYGQLPNGAEGAAALSMIFAYVSWCCSALMIWLTWAHNERLSYITCIAYFTLFSTTASIIQQIHEIVWWRDIAFEQYERKVADPDSGDISIGNGSVGVDLVLFYIQFYSYNVQSLFILFWASELAQSIYGLTEIASWRAVLRRVNASGKIASVFIPIIFILAARTPVIRNSHSSASFELLAGIPFLISLGLGSVLMLAILFRYIQSRRKLVRFNPHNRVISLSSGSSSVLKRNSRGTVTVKYKGIYDKWLMTRFTIAFILLAAFQVSTILFEQIAKQNAKKDIQASAPDLSAERARLSLYLFLPGNTPGIALFVVFGTTASFRSYMYQTLVPRRWQARVVAEAETETELVRGPSVSTTCRTPKTSAATLPWREKEIESRMAFMTPVPNNSAGLSLAVYGPVRPARAVGHDGRRPDLEWGGTENYTGAMFKHHGSNVR
ncbi:hypothetical protein F5Y19DRAFT_228450 [Xylariaceae sp. FL1651]|nr:hypothetical protein F5Y19DRAFT_228450 [Xylariaceae sp. FL1651]